MAYSAWHTGKAVTLFISFFANLVWIITTYLGGTEYSHTYIWFINFFTQGGGFLVVALLFLKIHEAMERERSISRTDPLTGLANSRSFFETANRVLTLCGRNQRPVTLAYVDLDNFKNANDTLGHQYGDKLLRKVAEVFGNNLRNSDIKARMGGDEFAILLPETSGKEAYVVLEKIRQTLEQAPEFSTCRVTASIGAVSYVKAPLNIEVMIKAADDLMYEAKNASKNRVLVAGCQ